MQQAVLNAATLEHCVFQYLCFTQEMASRKVLDGMAAGTACISSALNLFVNFSVIN